MKTEGRFCRSRRAMTLWLTLTLIAAALYLATPSQALEGIPPTADEFVPAAPQGFGDRQNSWAWAMQWWRGHLYVGTNRAWHCAEIASLAYLLPDHVEYPPDDPDIECTPDPADLPLQAEIWRWTPDTDRWERVYQSPADVPLPGPQDNKFIARDIGYRGMTVFREADGTEALYVTGVSPQFIGFPGLDKLPPRILRSTDGVHFEPIPQDPGTALWNFPFSVFRNPISYNGRFYVTGGTVQGSGVLLESEHPELGNDSFRIVSPPGMIVSDLAVFNGWLYAGIANRREGYGVVKTDARGEPPYTFVTVVEKGGYLQNGANSEILSMEVFNGRLYAGGNGIKIGSLGPGAAAELIRINPDDTWDLVVGYPRVKPGGGVIYPISGLQAGFGNVFNAHMWHLVSHNGVLYVGTFDSSTTLRNDPELGEYARLFMGFDLYASVDGVHFTPITTDGLGNPFDFGVRTFASTPYGLFLGTANYYYGLNIWRVNPSVTVDLPLPSSWSLLSIPFDLPNNLVQEALASIEGYYDVVLSFEQAGLTYIPGKGDFNTLRTVDAEHGYWVRVREEYIDLVLRLLGRPQPTDLPIHLESGWNLVSYLVPTPLSVSTALQSIAGKYTTVLGYDRGALSYYSTLPPQLSTLNTMEPYKGYWIYMTEPAILRYPLDAFQGGTRAQAMRPLLTYPTRVFLPLTTGGLANRPQIVPGVKSTNQWINVYSLNSTVDGRPLPVGARVTVIGEDGRKLGEVRAQQAGWYGVLAVYGDDPYTPEVDGARPGERLRFLIDDQPAVVVDGDEPVWTSNGALLRLDLATEAASR